ncbi:MAG: OsmC family protein [Myxococcales bacterium]|nr:OsmC family protein [Myxococcales bacterium]
MTTQTQTVSSPAPQKTKREVVARNGVNTPALFATIGAVKGQPELAQFTFRAQNRWVKGTGSVSTAGSFTGAGGEHEHKQDFAYPADHPPVLCGEGNGPTPVEYLLGALASCITAGIANIAAARGVDLEEVESSVEGAIDLQGLLGLNDDVRNGYQGIKLSFKVKGDASEQKLREIVEQSRKRSAVYDVLTNGVPVAIEVAAG